MAGKKYLREKQTYQVFEKKNQLFKRNNEGQIFAKKKSKYLGKNVKDQNGV